MASAAGQKPLILTRPEKGRIKNPVRRPSGFIIYAIAALLLVIIAGYLLFSGSFPTVSETVPSPDIDSTVPPAPTAPPPADAPAANP
jgi:hypothetical protein